MTLEAWSVYVAVYLVVCLTPGPAVLFVTSQSAWRGRKAGLAAVKRRLLDAVGAGPRCSDHGLPDSLYGA